MPTHAALVGYGTYCSVIERVVLDMASLGNTELTRLVQTVELEDGCPVAATGLST